MTRVAIAGTGGLACAIANCLHTETGHPFILLSRAAKPFLTERGYQVIVVDYDDSSSLEFALKGVQVLISTVSGSVQFRLIDAALRVGVTRFAPAEFEGLPSLRPVDSLDRSKKAILNYLHQNSNKLNWTCFVCGVLYERFAPGGMQTSNIGLGTGIAGEGDYMMNLEQMTAEVPLTNAAGQPVAMCLTAADDVGRFVVRSLEMRTWPQELTMYGERLTVQQVVAIAENVKAKYFYPNITWHNFESLQQSLSAARTVGDRARYYRLFNIVATQEGRYDFDGPVLNARYPEIKPKTFQEWLEAHWPREQRTIPAIRVMMT